MKDPEFVRKAEEIVMRYGPLPARQIANITGYEGYRPGRALGRAKNLFYMGNTHSGVWYLEHQILEAKNQYHDICEGIEKRREALNNEVRLYLPPNPKIHSLLSLFRTNEDTYTAKQSWKIAGGSFIVVRRHLGKLEKDEILIAKGRPKTFRRNPNPTLDCMFGDAAEEIFAERFTSDKQS